MATGFATVKAVLTGDTLVLMGRAVNGPPPELQLSLSGVTAPRLARGPNGTDEPCAWEAREFLRKLALGKTVQFRQDPNPKGGRNYGAVWLPSPTAGGPPVSLAEAVLRGGWTSVSGRRSENTNDDPSASTELIAAENEAKEARRGAHALDASAKSRCVRQVKWNADAVTYATKYKDKAARAIVEYVKDGSNMRCILLPDFAVINVSLAGVRCGRLNKPATITTTEDGKETQSQPVPAAAKSEPYAEEARFFVESRLLNREIELTFAQIDRYGNAMCVVKHTAGLIAIELLKEGLGKISEPGLANGIEPAEAAALREAEKVAKKQQKRLWRGYEPPQVSGIEKEFDAYIIEVVSGDQLAVVRTGSEEALTNEVRIQLSSVRAPRIGNPRAERSSEPWADEARECLRSVAIGKRCRVRVEYVKDMAEIAAQQAAAGADGSSRTAAPSTAKATQNQLRIFANVTLSSGVNRQGTTRRDLAEIVIAHGLAATVQPRTSDERAERFDFLLQAEKDAKAKKLGTHSGKSPPPPAKIQELMGDAKKARAFLPQMQQKKSHKALVEAVFSGSRFKLRLPSENCSIVLALAACRAPAPSGASRSAESGGDESKAFARRYLNQRMIDATISDMDRNGVALGSVHVSSPEGDYESRLLQRGLARLDRRRADQQTAGTEIGNKYKKWADHEKQAIQKKMGLWADQTNVAEYDQQEQDKADRAAALASAATDQHQQNAKDAKRWRAKIADIADGSTCFLHDLDAKTARGQPLLEAISSKMRALPSASSDTVSNFKRNQVVAARFEGEWCRAKITECDKAKTVFKLRYLDYGNIETEVPASRLRALDSEIAALPAAALEASLAYIAVSPVDDEVGEVAASTLHELAWDKTLIVEQHADFYHASDKANAKRVVLKLFDNPDSSINEKLVEAGLARVPRMAKRDASKTVDAPQYLQKLLELESKARNARLALWRYGDVDYSENEDN